MAPAVNWYSDLYSCLEMCASVAAIEQDEEVKRQWWQFLKQAVGRSGEIGSSMQQTSSFNYNTEQWELEWPKEKIGTANLMSFSRDNTNYKG
eukprot:13664114-Ditylum_brightwellii.AAC.2